MDTNNKIKLIKQDCWDKALDAFAYCYIYSKKIEKLNYWLRASKLLGILIPVLVGGIVASYVTNKELIDFVVWLTSPFAISQLVLSTYLTVGGADEKVNSYSFKTAEYSLLNSEFQNLARLGDEDDITDLQHKYNVLVERERSVAKGNFEVSDNYKRMGMCAGLREYRRNCVACKKTPLAIKTSDCDVCGNFKL